MNKNLKIIFSMLGSVFLAILSYITLHEGGHCLVAVLNGAEITEFNILEAHMSYTGGAFSSAALSIFYVAGMLLPVFISFVFILFYSQKNTNIFYRIFSFIFSLIPLFSLLAWFFVPMLYSSGKAPVTDDVIQFINNSGINPWVVCLAAITLFVCGIVLACKKGIVKNYCFTCRAQITDDKQN